MAKRREPQQQQQENKEQIKEIEKSEEKSSGSGLCVPGFLDKYTVNVAVEDITVDVRRALNAEDRRVVAVISALRVQPPGALERGKPLIPSIFTDTQMTIDRIYTVCGGFVQGLADDMRIAFSITPDNDLVFRTIQLTLGFGRNHLAAFYGLALAFKQVEVPPLSLLLPPELLDRSFRPRTKALTTTKGKNIRIRCELPEITLAWVECFTCTISRIEFCYVGTTAVDDIDIKVRSITVADNHVDKMAAHPILSLLEKADGSPAVGVNIRISEEVFTTTTTTATSSSSSIRSDNIAETEGTAIVVAAAATTTTETIQKVRRVVSPTIRMSVINIFATPEIIDTAVGDITWMQSYSIRVFDDGDNNNSHSKENTEDEDEDEEKARKALEQKQNAEQRSAAVKRKIADSVANFELRVTLEVAIGGISAHFYEDYTALYCIGAFGVSLERFAVAIATPSVRQAEGQKVDIETLDIAVHDLRISAGFRCSSAGEEEVGPRAVALRCPRVHVWITDGELSSLTVGMDVLSVDVQAELLTAFAARAGALKLNVTITRAKNVVRHADMRHAPWDIDSASINEAADQTVVRAPDVLDMVAGLKQALDKGMSAKITLGDINIAARTLTGYALVLNVAGFECLLDDVAMRRVQLVVSAQALEHSNPTQLLFPWKITLTVLNSMDTPSVQVLMDNMLMAVVNPQGLKRLCLVLDAIRKGSSPETESEPVFVNASTAPTTPAPISSDDDDDEASIEDATPKEVERDIVLESACPQGLLDVKGTVTVRPTVGKDLHRVTVAGWGTRTWEGEIPAGVRGLAVRNEASGEELCLVLKRQMSSSGEAGAVVESLLSAINKTDFELGLVFAADNDNDTTESCLHLRPRARAYVPPQFLARGVDGSGSFCVEAANTRTLSKHREVEIKRQHCSAPVPTRRRPGTRCLEELRIERPDSAAGKKRWFYLTLAYDVSPQKIPAIGGSNSSSAWFTAGRVVFLPTLYVENSLPTQVTVELTDQATHEVTRVAIASGNTTSILDIQRKEVINLMATVTVSTHPSAPVVVGTLKAQLRYPSPKADPTEQLRPAGKGRKEAAVDVLFDKVPELNGIVSAGLVQEEAAGIWRLRLYSRSILVNTTGLQLEVKNGSLLPLESTDSSVSLLNFRPSKGLYLRRVGAKDWSVPAYVASGYSGVVTIPGAECAVAVKAEQCKDGSGSGSSELLRVYLWPLYTIYNELGFPVHVRQPLSKLKERSAGRVLENRERADVFCNVDEASKDCFVTLKVEGFEESEPINISTYTENKREAIRIHSTQEKDLFKIIHIVNTYIHTHTSDSRLTIFFFPSGI